MQKYQCHKVVEAAVINEVDLPRRIVSVVEPDGSFSALEDLPARIFMSDNHPQSGDYLVQYDDGYISWSPKAQFEAGYTVIA